MRLDYTDDDVRWRLLCNLTTEVQDFVENELHDLNDPTLVGTKFALEVQKTMDYLEKHLTIKFNDNELRHGY